MRHSLIFGGQQADELDLPPESPASGERKTKMRMSVATLGNNLHDDPFDKSRAAWAYFRTLFSILIGLRPCRRPLFPYVGMPYIIGRNPQKIISVRFPRFSPSVHLFGPGTNLFFRFSMKLAGSPESQPKRLHRTPLSTFSTPDSTFWTMYFWTIMFWKTGCKFPQRLCQEFSGPL